MAVERASAVLKGVFCAFVLALAFYQFSEDTADPDLWAHTMVGERVLLTGHLQRVEPYSWTAPGTPWINHELLAEMALGGAHLLAGGRGIFLLKVLVGFADLWPGAENRRRRSALAGARGGMGRGRASR